MSEGKSALSFNCWRNSIVTALCLSNYSSSINSTFQCCSRFIDTHLDDILSKQCNSILVQILPRLKTNNFVRIVKPGHFKHEKETFRFKRCVSLANSNLVRIDKLSENFLLLLRVPYFVNYNEASKPKPSYDNPNLKIMKTHPNIILAKPNFSNPTANF